MHWACAAHSAYNFRMLNASELTGRAATHVVRHAGLGAALHPAALGPFLAMCAAAARDGIELEVVSAFRDFAAQQSIWDCKFMGERPLYDAQGNVRERPTTDQALIDAIVCWSAVPGASRHHWGSDLDVIDRAAVPAGYEVRLLPDEAAPGGVFSRLHRWLDTNIGRFGFYRPYRTFRGGVFPEPWHLSYAPVSTRALQQLTLEVVEEAVRGSEIRGKVLVLRRLAEIHHRYVEAVDTPGPECGWA